MSITNFVETECKWGGVACGAWSDWFVACDEADPNAIDEERDPAELTEFTFHPIDCAAPDVCPLYARCRKEAGL